MAAIDQDYKQYPVCIHNIILVNALTQKLSMILYHYFFKSIYKKKTLKTSDIKQTHLNKQKSN